MSEPKPTGSGIFALVSGAAFMVAFFGSFNWDFTRLSPNWILRMWLLFVTAVLAGWGIRRIVKGRRDLTVGQDTINFVVALVGTTVALIGILFHRG